VVVEGADEFAVLVLDDEAGAAGSGTRELIEPFVVDRRPHQASAKWGSVTLTTGFPVKVPGGPTRGYAGPAVVLLQVA